MQTISRIIVPQIHFCRNIFCTQYSREKPFQYCKNCCPCSLNSSYVNFPNITYLTNLFPYLYTITFFREVFLIRLWAWQKKSKDYNQKNTFSEMDIRSAGPARTRACEQGVQVPLREDLVKTVPGGNMLLNFKSSKLCKLYNNPIDKLLFSSIYHYLFSEKSS